MAAAVAAADYPVDTGLVVPVGPRMDSPVILAHSSMGADPRTGWPAGDSRIHWLCWLPRMRSQGVHWHRADRRMVLVARTD